MPAVFTPDVNRRKTKYKVGKGLPDIKIQLPQIISGVGVCHFILPHSRGIKPPHIRHITNPRTLPKDIYELLQSFPSPADSCAAQK